ncbi:GNAT family N-acetyltransferase [Amylibacter sp. SFDW26]|uniref:GNAT family N-acetyltransferase n=1 Tax=Amylibacter sp. SFDW26 TaxID=2652722 RepID=UPI001261554C|nr:N-acetyltransferase [Amylibacter sp. SFDW26]KAB7614647.1 GNAT family N-acetyltransferase [Amylibacter sp. SFDW26]
MIIRRANTQDRPEIWAILKPVFRSGETYAVNPDISEKDALSYWIDGSHTAFVVEYEKQILGTYYICPNQSGHGAHICNCGFITHPDAQGKGIARAMIEHSLKAAPEMGFRGMQFNFVLASNERAIATWQKYGFDIIGHIPEAFNHPKIGYVDALVMYKKL